MFFINNLLRAFQHLFLVFRFLEGMKAMLNLLTCPQSFLSLFAGQALGNGRSGVTATIS